MWQPCAVEGLRVIPTYPLQCSSPRMSTAVPCPLFPDYKDGGLQEIRNMVSYYRYCSWSIKLHLHFPRSPSLLTRLRCIVGCPADHPSPIWRQDAHYYLSYHTRECIIYLNIITLEQAFSPSEDAKVLISPTPDTWYPLFNSEIFFTRP